MSYHLITGRTSKLPGDYRQQFSPEQITAAASVLSRQATLSTGDEDAIANAAKRAGDYCPVTGSHEVEKYTRPNATWSGNLLTIQFNGRAIGKPRQTRRDKWRQRPSVVAYREWADALRAVAGALPLAESVVALSWTAVFSPPDSWTKKRRAETIGKLHRTKPDRDNIDKAILDALYPDGDAAIASGWLRKVWGWTDELLITIEVQQAMGGTP